MKTIRSNIFHQICEPHKQLEKKKSSNAWTQSSQRTKVEMEWDRQGTFLLSYAKKQLNTVDKSTRNIPNSMSRLKFGVKTKQNTNNSISRKQNERTNYAFFTHTVHVANDPFTEYSQINHSLYKFSFLKPLVKPKMK